LDGWHRFVASVLLRPPSAEYIVFGLPCVQSPGEMIEFEVMIRPLKARRRSARQQGAGSDRNWPG
jgi:hypothetical protein